MSIAAQALTYGHDAAIARFSVARYQRMIETGERIVVGVNRFRQDARRAIPTFRIDPALERAQTASLRQMRASRSAATVTEKLDALEQTARGAGNLMPAIVDASAAYAAELPVSPDDLAATVFHRLGIPLDAEIHDPQGRPIPLCTGKPVLGLFYSPPRFPCPSAKLRFAPPPPAK